MSRTVSATEARVHFGEMLREVNQTGEPIYVEKAGSPVAVILSLSEYRRLRESPCVDWQELVRKSQHAFTEARERGDLPDAVGLINAGRDERDRQLLENLR